MGGKRIHTFLGGANPVGGAKVIPRSRGHRYVGGAEILVGGGGGGGAMDPANNFASSIFRTYSILMNQVNDLVSEDCVTENKCLY